MADTTITGARIVTEDRGTGRRNADGTLVEPSRGDFVSAADLAGIIQTYGIGSFVRSGCTVTAAAGSADITAGLIFLTATGPYDVQDQDDGTYSEQWGQPATFAVQVPSITGLALSTTAANDIYLAIDLTANGGNGAFYRHGSGVTEPTTPSVKIATVSSGMVVTETGRQPDADFGSATVRNPPSSNVDVARKADLYTDTQAKDAARFTVLNQATNYTANDRESVLADASGGPITITLPNATNSPSPQVEVKKTDASTNAVTIATNGGTIDGEPSKQLTKQNYAMTMRSDGSNYYTF